MLKWKMVGSQCNFNQFQTWGFEWNLYFLWRLVHFFSPHSSIWLNTCYVGDGCDSKFENPMKTSKNVEKCVRFIIDFWIRAKKEWLTWMICCSQYWRFACGETVFPCLSFAFSLSLPLTDILTFILFNIKRFFASQIATVNTIFRIT